MFDKDSTVDIIGENGFLKYKMNREFGGCAGLQYQDIFYEASTRKFFFQFVIDHTDQAFSHLVAIFLWIVFSQEFKIKVQFARFS